MSLESSFTVFYAKTMNDGNRYKYTLNYDAPPNKEKMARVGPL